MRRVLAVLILAALVTAPAAAQSPCPPSTPTVTFGDGTYLVSTDVAPGTYRGTSIGDPGCYWARLSGLGGELGDVIANGYVVTAGSVLVTIADTDAAFTSQYCGPWELVEP